MARLPDEHLRAILTTERRAYRQVALAVAAEELRRRGLSPTPPVTVNQRATRSVQRQTVAAPQAQGQTGEGLELFCEIVCAALSSILLVIVFVSGRETQKAILRWAGTSIVLPYTVWRGARLLDRRWQGAHTGQATN
jgi:hypothetical protein